MLQTSTSAATEQPQWLHHEVFWPRLCYADNVRGQFTNQTGSTCHEKPPFTALWLSPCAVMQRAVHATTCLLVNIRTSLPLLFLFLPPYSIRELPPLTHTPRKKDISFTTLPYTKGLHRHLQLDSHIRQRVNPHSYFFFRTTPSVSCPSPCPRMGPTTTARNAASPSTAQNLTASARITRKSATATTQHGSR